MQRNFLRFCLLTAALLSVSIACTQAGAQPPRPAGTAPERPAERASPEKAAGFRLTCETYCSETKLRTANARIRWQVVADPARAETRAENLAQAEQRLEATVFKNGFEKGLYVSLPVVEPNAARLSEPRVFSPQGRLRAFEIRVIDVERPRPAERLAAGSEEIVAVIENLEPGVKYTWRLAVDTAAGDLVTDTVRCQAPVCPADMIREEDKP